MQEGDRLTAGDIYGEVQENSLMVHRIMVPPNARGNVTYIAPEGEYSLEDKTLELDFQGTKKVEHASAPTPLSLDVLADLVLDLRLSREATNGRQWMQYRTSRPQQSATCWLSEGGAVRVQELQCATARVKACIPSRSMSPHQLPLACPPVLQSIQCEPAVGQWQTCNTCL